MTTLYKYQRQGVRQIEKFGGRVLLADEMGLGKTLQALWWAQNFLPKSSTVVVVCPSSIKFNWQREARTHCGFRADVLSSRTPQVDELDRGRTYVINYDILYGSKSEIGKKGRLDKIEGSWLELLLALEPDLVVVDECHYVKSLEAKRTKAVQALCRDVPHVIMISGTPLTNRPAELFPALNILLPAEFPTFGPYAWRYCNPQRKPWGMEFKGATNLPELHGRLKDLCMIRRRKEDVLKELPAKVRTVIPMELSTADQTEYKKAEKEFVQWLFRISPAKARKAAKAEYLVKRGYLLRLAGMMKQKLCIEWIENFLEESEGKLIFFGIHINFLEPIYQHFAKRAVLVNGSVKAADRQKAFDAFNKDKRKRLFIGNIHAAGVGWNGQVAQDVAFGELAWTPGEHMQAEDRTHRIGQLGSVNCHYLVSEGTIESDLCDILQTKQKVLTSTLDGLEDIELDISIQLENKLLRKNGLLR